MRFLLERIPNRYVFMNNNPTHQFHIALNNCVVHCIVLINSNTVFEIKKFRAKFHLRKLTNKGEYFVLKALKLSRKLGPQDFITIASSLDHSNYKTKFDLFSGPPCPQLMHTLQDVTSVDFE